MDAPQSCWPRGDSNWTMNGSWPQSATTPPTIRLLLLLLLLFINRLLVPHATLDTWGQTKKKKWFSTAAAMYERKRKRKQKITVLKAMDEGRREQVEEADKGCSSNRNGHLHDWMDAGEQKELIGKRISLFYLFHLVWRWALACVCVYVCEISHHQHVSFVCLSKQDRFRVSKFKVPSVCVCVFGSSRESFRFWCTVHTHIQQGGFSIACIGPWVAGGCCVTIGTHKSIVFLILKNKFLSHCLSYLHFLLFLEYY